MTLKLSASGRLVKADDFAPSPIGGARLCAQTSGDVAWYPKIADVQRADWSLSVSGSDSNAGDSLHPLRTLAELNRRLGGRDHPINQNLTIQFLTDHEGGALEVVADPGVTVTVLGVAQVVGIAQVASWTGRSTASNQWDLLGLTGIADLSANVPKRLRVTSGTHTDAVLWIDRVDPYSLGVGVAEVSHPVVPSQLTLSGVIFSTVLDLTDLVTIETLPVIDRLFISVVSGDSRQVINTGNRQAIPRVVLHSVVCTSFGLSHTLQELRSVVAWGCRFVNWSVSSARGAVEFQGCHFKCGQSEVSPATYLNCLLTSNDSNNVKDSILRDSEFKETIFDGLSCIQEVGSIVLDTCGIFRGITALWVKRNAFALVTSPMGQGNSAYGMRVDRDAVVRNNTSTWTSWVLTGTSGDCQINSTTLTWATHFPRAWFSGTGTGTLTTGNLVVSVPGMPTDAIVTVCYVIPKVGAGILGVTAQTASGFTVHSLDATDSTSTVNWSWRSPRAGAGGVFNS
jgi:hypothetical protein